MSHTLLRTSLHYVSKQSISAPFSTGAYFNWPAKPTVTLSPAGIEKVTSRIRVAVGSEPSVLHSALSRGAVPVSEKCRFIQRQNRSASKQYSSIAYASRNSRAKMSEGSESAATKPKIVFVLGAPGAGKGTQCEKIVQTYGYTHLSAGDLLREERKREGSEYGALIEDNIKNGRIVPVEITCALLENAMNKTMESTGNNKFLIDGFPRNDDNLDGWNRKMSSKVQLQFVLFFECSEDQCVERCLKRGESSGRADDNLESLKKRFNTYVNDTMPIINHYREQNLVKTIDAAPAPDDVFAKVKLAFEEDV